VSIKQLKTYNTTMLPLDFTVSEPASWLGYSLDGEASVPITGNTTLSGLSDGTHTIVVQAEDSTGSVGASAPVTFTVGTQTAGQQTGSESSPFPTTLITVGITVAIGAIISIGLVVYSLRRKRKSGETGKLIQLAFTHNGHGRRGRRKSIQKEKVALYALTQSLMASIRLMTFHSFTRV